jgi:hypothetical protein
VGNLNCNGPVPFRYLSALLAAIQSTCIGSDTRRATIPTATAMSDRVLVHRDSNNNHLSIFMFKKVTTNGPALCIFAMSLGHL